MAKNYPRDNFFDSQSKGGPALMHSKVHTLRWFVVVLTAIPTLCSDDNSH